MNFTISKFSSANFKPLLMSSDEAESDVLQDSLNLATIRSAIAGALKIVAVSDPVYIDRDKKVFNFPSEIRVVKVMVSNQTFQFWIFINSSYNSVFMVSSQEDFFKWFIPRQALFEHLQAEITNGDIIIIPSTLEVL